MSRPCRGLLLAIALGSAEPVFAACDNTPAGRQSMLALFARRAAEHGTTVHVVYEASSLGFGLHDEIVAAGWACWVLAPSKLPRSTKQRKTRTDKKDAELLLSVLRGHLLAGNELPAVWVPDAELRERLAGCSNGAAGLLRPTSGTVRRCENNPACASNAERHSRGSGTAYIGHQLAYLFRCSPVARELGSWLAPTPAKAPLHRT